MLSGYRGQFHYNGLDWDAPHEYPDVEQVNPGDTVKAYLAFMRPGMHFKNIYEGMEFLVREGSRTVGKGTIVKILDLETSVKRNKLNR